MYETCPPSLRLVGLSLSREDGPSLRYPAHHDFLPPADKAFCGRVVSDRGYDPYVPQLAGELADRVAKPNRKNATIFCSFFCRLIGPIGHP